MIDKIKALALILERMTALHGRVLALLERERETLIRLDYEALFQTIREKDEVLAALRGLDRDRLRLQDYFAVVMDAEPEQLTLLIIAQNLISQGDVEHGARLIALRERLGTSVEEVRQKVERNRNFIERSVQNLQSIAGSISDAVTGRPGRSSRKSNVYDKNKRYEETTGHKGSLLEKRL